MDPIRKTGKWRSFLLLLLVAVPGTMGYATCTGGSRCVDFTRCRELCILARSGEIMRNHKVFLEVKERLCGFSTNEPRHCCPREEVMGTKYCSLQEMFQPPANNQIQGTDTVTKETSPGSESISKLQPTCGEITQSTIFDNRCVGCDISNPGQWPWTALFLIGETKKPLCGGSLLSRKHVATAAHCFLSIETAPVVVLGEADLKSEYDCLFGPAEDCQLTGKECYLAGECADTAKTFQIEKTLIHPGFRSDEGAADPYDLAVVVLAGLARFSDYIQPICLPSTPEEPSQESLTTLIVAGWGNDRVGPQRTNSTTSDVLKHLPVQQVESTRCSTLYSRDLQATEGCISSLRWGKSLCRGDSGVAIALRNKQGLYEMIGIVSAGDNICGHPEVSFISVTNSEIRNWIIEQMNAN